MKLNSLIAYIVFWFSRQVLRLSTKLNILRLFPFDIQQLYIPIFIICNVWLLSLVDTCNYVVDLRSVALINLFPLSVHREKDNEAVWLILKGASTCLRAFRAAVDIDRWFVPQLSC